MFGLSPSKTICINNLNTGTMPSFVLPMELSSSPSSWAPTVDAIHQVVGVCPQFDLVFSDLTVKEHFEFYCKLKGLPKNTIRGEMQRIAETVELDGDAFNRASSQLSGGMRRRLSIGIALIGNPSIVFLDEPSTGLDPGSRAQLWKIIEKAKEGRCLVITTHSMEEADALCTRIGIVAAGELRCLGSQLHLKNKFGSGYRLVVQLTDEEASDTFILSEVTNLAVRVLRAGATVEYNIPKAAVKLSKLFGVMDRLKRQPDVYRIKEWGIAQTSLEEVFIKIALAAEEAASLAPPSLSHV